MTKNSKQGVIWDVDGTLVDTAGLHFQAWTELCRAFDRPLTFADFAATFGQRNPEILGKLFGTRFNDAEVAELGDRKEVLYRAAARRGVSLLPGVRALLEGLHAAGLRQAIGSSAPRENIDLIIDLTDTGPFFDAVVSMEDTKRGKPDPQVCLVAAERLQVMPQQCVVVEDAPSGVQAAKAGGMKCIGVTFVGPHLETSLRSAGADLLVKTLEEVSVDRIRRLLAAD